MEPPRDRAKSNKTSNPINSKKRRKSTSENKAIASALGNPTESASILLDFVYASHPL
jgi:hypothetical protein